MLNENLTKKGIKIITEQNILKSFCLETEPLSVSKQIALSLYHLMLNLSKNETEKILGAWQNSMNFPEVSKIVPISNEVKKRRLDLSLIFNDIIDSNETEQKAIYSLQTTYSIILKLFSLRTLNIFKYNKETISFDDILNIKNNSLQSFFKTMENGSFYTEQNLINYLSEDLFSWYANVNWNIYLKQNFINLLKEISSYSPLCYDIGYQPTDVFKNLYMSIIPQSIRYSMGEYFTPSWLADYVINNSILNNERIKAIDPCCGSGVFIISLIKNIIKPSNIKTLTDKEKEKLKEFIVNNVYGIDINPLSVLSTKINYYFALQSFECTENIEFSVYCGDSAILPQKIKIDNIDCYAYLNNQLTEPITYYLPERLVNQKSFCKTMLDLNSYIEKNPFLQHTSIFYHILQKKNVLQIV